MSASYAWLFSFFFNFVAQRGPNPEHTPPNVCSPTLPNPCRGDKKLQAIQQIGTEHCSGYHGQKHETIPFTLKATLLSGCEDQGGPTAQGCSEGTSPAPGLSGVERPQPPGLAS